MYSIVKYTAEMQVRDEGFKRTNNDINSVDRCRTKSSKKMMKQC